ncbi:MAG TPA: RraA family protein [Galbitalea sp.]|jgi:regulator of RNase E activity RraA|nr:RraA family protein [Galbitalea sp.]
MSFAERPRFLVRPGDENLTSAVLSDSLDAAGLRSQVLERRLAPLVPGSRAFGRAWTVRFEPSTTDHPDDPYGEAIDYISAIQPGEIALIGTGQSNESAFWGELFSAAAIGAGAVGVVTDGNLRDTEKIIGLGFPAFSVSRRPIDYRARMRVAEIGGSVRLCGVDVSVGDLVLADDDGVVVIPRAREDEVLGLARARAAAESTVLRELLAGETLRAVWNRHGVL